MSNTVQAAWLASKLSICGETLSERTYFSAEWAASVFGTARSPLLLALIHPLYPNLEVGVKYATLSLFFFIRCTFFSVTNSCVAGVVGGVGVRGVTRGKRGAQFPGRRITMAASNHCGERRKVPSMSQVLSSMQYICFRKSSGSNMGWQTCFLPQTPSNLVGGGKLFSTVAWCCVDENLFESE